MASERGNQQAYPDVRRTFRYPNGTETIATGAPGMTIREAFAMSVAGDPPAWWLNQQMEMADKSGYAEKGIYHLYAKWRVNVADALLAVLAEKKP